MTLHEASAVFLIIGGVLLGPIDGQLLDERGKGLNTLYTECIQSYGGFEAMVVRQMMNCGPLDQFHFETTAEACARAMREVGAVKGRWIENTRYEEIRPHTFGSVATGLDPLFQQGAQGTEFSLPDKKTRVLCIPAPSGLVKQ